MVAAVIAGTTVGTVTTAQAAEPTVAVQAGRLVLEPGERGYRGLLPVTITYQGDDATSVNVNFVEPVTGSFVTILPSDACVFWPSDNPSDNGRRDVSCGGGEFQPGETRRVDLEFQVLTTPRDYAMRAADTTIEVALNPNSAVRATATSRTLFRSTTGSIAKPQPYVQDTQSDLSVTAGDATLTEQADGSYAGRVPVTVRSASDVPHFEAFAEFALPAGFTVTGTDPESMCGGGCYVPGGQFMQGESRTFDVLVSAEGVAPGTTATGSTTVSATWYSEVTDVDPSDNTAKFTLTVR
jgi:hypothetical protein